MGGAEVAAGVVLKVDDEVLHALLLELGDGLADLVGRVLGKAADADVSHLGVNHVRGVDTVDGYVVADKAEVDELGRAGALDLEGHLAALGAAQRLEHVVVDHLGTGEDGVVDVDDAVAGEDAGLLRRAVGGGLHDGDSVADYRELDADAAEMAFEGLRQLLRLFGVGV